MTLRPCRRWRRPCLQIHGSIRFFQCTPETPSPGKKKPDSEHKRVETVDSRSSDFLRDENLGPGFPLSHIFGADQRSSRTLADKPAVPKTQQHGEIAVPKTKKSVYSQVFLHLFTTNISLDTLEPALDTPITETRMSQLIHGAFEKSTNLAQQDNLPGAKNMDLTSLDQKLLERINRQVDNYNKLTLLLLQHPLAVPAEILLQLYHSIPYVHPSDKQTLLKRLAYHHTWTEFWEIAFAETTTLSDIEDITDVIYHEAMTNNSREFTFWRSLTVAHTILGNSGIFLSLCETMAYRFSIELQKCQKFFYFVNSEGDLDSIELCSDCSQKAVLALAFLSSQTSNKTKPDTIVHWLQRNKPLLEVRGFINELLKIFSCPKTAQFLITRSSLKLNEQDLFSLWLHVTNTHQHRILTHLDREIRRNTRISDWVKERVVTQAQDPQLQITLASKFYMSLSKEVVLLLFPKLMECEKGRQVLKKVNKKRGEVFETGAIEYIQGVEPGTDDYFWIIQQSNHRDGFLLGKALERLEGTTDNLDKLLRLRLSTSDLMKVWKYCLRNDLVGESVATSLFFRIMRKTWDYNELMGRQKKEFNDEATNVVGDFISSNNNKNNNDNENMLGKYRRLRHQIRVIAAGLALCDDNHIAAMLNNIQRQLFPPKKRAGSVSSSAARNDSVSAKEFKCDVDGTNSNGVEISTRNPAFKDFAQPGPEVDNRYGKSTKRTSDNECEANVDLQPFFAMNRRQYILLKLTQEVMKSINYGKMTPGENEMQEERQEKEERKEKDAIRKMGQVLRQLEFNSNEGQAAVFYHIVKHQPRASLRILQEHKENKPFLVRAIMNAIEQGILESEKIGKEEKLHLFEEFQDKKDELGYGAQTSARTIVLWGMLVVGREGKEELMREIAQKAVTKRIPMRVLRNWTCYKN